MKNLLKDFLDNLDNDTIKNTRPDLRFILEYPSIKNWVDEYCHNIQETFGYADEHLSRMLMSGVYDATLKIVFERADSTLNRNETVEHYKQDLDKLNAFLALKGY